MPKIQIALASAIKTIVKGSTRYTIDPEYNNSSTVPRPDGAKAGVKLTLRNLTDTVALRQ